MSGLPSTPGHGASRCGSDPPWGHFRADVLLNWKGSMHITAVIAALVISITVLMPQPAFTQPPPQELRDASLEELMNIRVTSAARKSQRAEDVAGAVYVITRGAIIASGLTRLPEILRLAPGVQVAQINASKWAVSIRGFNSLSRREPK